MLMYYRLFIRERNIVKENERKKARKKRTLTSK